MSKRIRELAALIPPCRCLADIGCDHGKLAEAVLESAAVSHVIASDVSESSLQKARTRLTHSEGVDFRVGDGLHVLRPGEADAVCIAGMGGREIQRIMSSAPEIAAEVRWFILGPHRNAAELRRHLRSSGYRISEERIVEERGQFYALMRAEHGREDCSDTFWDEVARGSPRDPVYRAYLADMARRIDRSVQGMERAARAPESLDVLRETAARIRRLGDL